MAKFELWIEGYKVTRQSSDATCLGVIEGENFNDAVGKYVSGLTPNDASFWSIHNDVWCYWGCRTFDNETDARRAFG